MSFILVVQLVNVVLVLAQIDYCKLCTDHVACNASRQFYPNCDSPTMIRFKKCWILQKHNAWRNLVAGGEVSNLKPACRMSYMHWDDELAALAVYNVVQCKIKRDKCIKTILFPRVAQNLGIMPYDDDGNELNVKAFIQALITNWYKEVHNVQQIDINTNKANSSDVGNITQFTAMMEDGTIRVGCAAATYKDGGKSVFLLVCNYGTRNVVGRPVYRTCIKPGEKCALKSQQYKNLCNRGEELERGLSIPKSISMRSNIGTDEDNFDNPWNNPWAGPWTIPGPNPWLYPGFNPNIDENQKKDGSERSSWLSPFFNPSFKPFNADENKEQFKNNPWSVPGPNPWFRPGFSPTDLFFPNKNRTQQSSKDQKNDPSKDPNYVPGYGMRNGPINSYNYNNRYKNKNNFKETNNGENNKDASSRGDRVANFVASIVKGGLNWSDENGKNANYSDKGTCDKSSDISRKSTYIKTTINKGINWSNNNKC